MYSKAYLYLVLPSVLANPIRLSKLNSTCSWSADKGKHAGQGLNVKDDKPART